MMKQEVNVGEELSKKMLEFHARIPEANELNLLQYVRNGFRDSGVPETTLVERFDRNRHVIDAMGKGTHVQQYHLSRYFTNLYMEVPEDTAVDRYCVVFELPTNDWIRVFDEKILPSLLAYGKP